jgi:hypothetical protein
MAPQSTLRPPAAEPLPSASRPPNTGSRLPMPPCLAVQIDYGLPSNSPNSNGTVHRRAGITKTRPRIGDSICRQGPCSGDEPAGMDFFSAPCDPAIPPPRSPASDQIGASRFSKIVSKLRRSLTGIKARRWLGTFNLRSIPT